MSNMRRMYPPDFRPSELEQVSGIARLLREDAEKQRRYLGLEEAVREAVAFIISCRDENAAAGGC